MDFGGPAASKRSQTRLVRSLSVLAVAFPASPMRDERGRASVWPTWAIPIGTNGRRVAGARRRTLPTSPIDFLAYTADRRISGRIMLADDRLSDMLNAVSRIVVRDAQVEELTESFAPRVADVTTPSASCWSSSGQARAAASHCGRSRSSAARPSGSAGSSWRAISPT